MMLLVLTFLSIHLLSVIEMSFIPPLLGIVTPRKCQPKLIKIEQCRNKFYQYTSSPNLMGQDQDNDIQMQMDNFRPLLKHNCSNQLNFFLCSLFTPICDPLAQIMIGPCVDICEKVQHECEPILKLFDLPWPTGMNCSRFPRESTTMSMCMSNPKNNTPTTTLKIHKFDQRVDTPMAARHYYHGRCKHLRHSKKYVFINRTGRCALKCHENDLFSQETKTFAEIWMTVLATITFLCTLFTCLTFCHCSRIRYPEQPIVFLTLSYNFYSCSLLLRVFLSRTAVSCDLDSISGQRILIQEGLENTYCAITFLFNYFFSTATHMWWVTITFGWLLYSVFKVSVSSFKTNAGYLHLFVWLSTSLLTISVLVLRCVDADELLGVCYVGEQSPHLLMTFSIIPKSVSLILGLIFLGPGYALLKSRKKTVNSKKVIRRSTSVRLPVAFRIGIFSSIYVMAISMLIICELYQYLNYNQWKWAPQIFTNVNEPAVSVFILKIFMSQVVGINSAIWVWSLDAAASWQKLYNDFKTKFQAKKVKKIVI